LGRAICYYKFWSEQYHDTDVGLDIEPVPSQLPQALEADVVVYFDVFSLARSIFEELLRV